MYPANPRFTPLSSLNMKMRVKTNTNKTSTNTNAPKEAHLRSVCYSILQYSRSYYMIKILDYSIITVITVLPLHLPVSMVAMALGRRLLARRAEDSEFRALGLRGLGFRGLGV